MKFYDFTAKDIDGNEINMSDYKDKVVLVVNTASKCGFTPQFEDLELIYEQYKNQGLEILGFPCNQFSSQDPGSNEEIKNFCMLNYGVSFTMFEKIDVNGDNTHPLYKFLKKESGGVLGSKIKWNFTKFLIDRNGNVVKRFAPNSEPKKFIGEIEKLLKENVND